MCRSVWHTLRLTAGREVVNQLPGARACPSGGRVRPRRTRVGVTVRSRNPALAGAANTHWPAGGAYFEQFWAKVLKLSIWLGPIRRIYGTRADAEFLNAAKQPGSDIQKKRKGDETTMRFMILLKANEVSESGVLPDEQLLSEMGKFNEELVKAGVLLAGEGLQPSSKGARVKFSGSRRTVIDGPFAETKELIAGYWLFQVKSKEEAIEWVKRCPNPLGAEAEIEIRQVFEAADFGAAFTPELREAEDRTGAEMAKNAKR